MKKQHFQRAFILALIILVAVPIFANGNSAAALGTAAAEVKKYWQPLKLLIQAIGGIVGLVGGIRIYSKWSNGDQDVNKELMGWAGACLFLILAPEFINSFFNMQ